MRIKQKQKRVFVSWSKYSSRTYSLALHLKAENYFTDTIKNRNKLYAPLRFVISAMRTLQILTRKNPDVVFVTNPPVFAILVVWLYCVFNKCKYVVDTHSGAFTYRRWALFLWLYRFLSKHALLNILHNEPLSHRVANWGAHTMTLGEVPVQLETNKTYSFRQGFNVLFVSSYADDEPLEEVLESALKMPSVNFYITGRLSLAPKDVISRIPDNVVLTDYLQNDDYVALLKGSHIVICLTKNDNTIQQGAYEGLALGRPVITSNWPVLRRIFYKGAICINNNSDELVAAINEIRNEYERFAQEIRTLQEELNAGWQRKFGKLLELLEKK